MTTQITVPRGRSVRAWSKLLGIGEMVLHGAIQRGELVAHQLHAKRITIFEDDLRAWFDAHRVKPRVRPEAAEIAQHLRKKETARAAGPSGS